MSRPIISGFSVNSQRFLIPNLWLLKGLFRMCLKRNNWEEDGKFDWCCHRSSKPNKTPNIVKTPEKLEQPKKESRAVLVKLCKFTFLM